MPKSKNALAPEALNAFLESRNTSWADKYGGAVPYYPSQRYIDKNLAPELNLSQQQLEALAQANQEARRSGLMSGRLADRMLPTLMVEGATGISSWGYPDTPKYREILTKAGLPPTLEEINNMTYQTDYDRSLRKSRLMHAVMAAKAAQYGDEKAIERWNGAGRVAGGGAVYADAANHARKVLEMERMLANPKNKPFRDAWAELTARYAKGAPPEARPLDEPLANENDPYWLWTIKNALGYEGASTDAPKNALIKAQNAIRNWTAY
jgi:hypothetical protein